MEIDRENWRNGVRSLEFYNKKHNRMPNKQVWSQEDYRTLKFLKQDKKIQDWDSIALILNQNCNNTRRTGKQCRYHYLTHARFSGEEDQPNDLSDWSQQQIMMLYRLFTQFGSKWTYISYHFPNRSQGKIKNKFYSSLRKAAREMTQIERKYNQSQKNSISYSMLLNVFDIANTLTSQHQDVFEKIDEDLRLAELKKSVMEYVFGIGDLSESNVVWMVKNIRKINARSRSLGIFKIKNRKNWKLTESGIQNLLGQNHKQQVLTKVQQLVE